jgi:hypothetical protein
MDCAGKAAATALSHARATREFSSILARTKAACRDWRAAFTPLQLTPIKTRKIVQRLRRCGR